DRSACLLQDLVLGQVGRFRSEVSVLNPATGCRRVLGDALQVGDGVLEAVLDRTELGTLAVDVGDRAVDDAQSVLSADCGTDVDILHAVQGGEASGKAGSSTSELECAGCFQ